MAIEKKLDQIIEILLRIEKKIGSETEKVTDGPITIETPQIDIPKKAAKPTMAQLKFQSSVELANRMDRNHFFTAIRSEALVLMKAKELDPNFKLKFWPQAMRWIDEKIEKSPAQFYKDLKVKAARYCEGVTNEGEEVLKRAIGRLTARAK